MMPVAGDLANTAAAGRGRLVVVLGPSGAGKDTLMEFARRAFAGSDDIVFVRRAITRAADAGNEDHVAMTEVEFDAAVEDSRFCLTWSANGLRYGLPRTLQTHLAAGKIGVVNGSRGAWSVIKTVFPSAVAVEIAVDPIILAQRLRSRGRESAAEIAERIKRAEGLKSAIDADMVIDNSGAVATAGGQLVDYMRRAIAANRSS
ncbi:phosphonate metabolism protein/1,5-bisphosphokinase (PRPP-forming) PhnN [Hoeflea sp. YIM 152468]|uniref:phosphonate metabolism protein/1,5-bisphosphokinase (PRPP-forming) PhnN n=1 Tax=Hoeflea sp. YIM 152468 TaxID=3031759 RepID=UPI0023DC7501|nr:phosphonate metabolism protein/1,5-bisphosphokinase (PRPP-forming) PhnN [Hoeflea sp. YIM 152468]MDF1609452.1 phosphonate metabolism protein/1,5-bisphosphokinase (PRPP-forming) PhnN [Hoeflea sp. YIM 152468]